ncbi:MAG: hypothetical protein MHM6MM_003659 [Cercozoa sp. M6MM]
MKATHSLYFESEPIPHRCRNTIRRWLVPHAPGRSFDPRALQTQTGAVKIQDNGAFVEPQPKRRPAERLLKPDEAFVQSRSRNVDQSRWLARRAPQIRHPA